MSLTMVIALTIICAWLERRGFFEEPKPPHRCQCAQCQHKP